jgi:hypothetical protein
LRDRGKPWKRLETNAEDLSLGFALCKIGRGWIRGNKEKEFPKFSLYVSFILQLALEVVEGQAVQSRYRSLSVMAFVYCRQFWYWDSCFGFIGT